MDWGLVIIAFIVFVIAIAGLAVGVLMGRPCLKGSCGGLAGGKPRGQDLVCDHCPNRPEETRTEHSNHSTPRSS